MTTPGALPPGLAPDNRVVLFDGVCRLCSTWVRWLLRADRHARFRLAAMQSPAGQAILTWYGLPTDHHESMLLVDNGRLHQKSSAFLHILRQLPLPWRAGMALQAIPRPVRDWAYDRVARNRYRWFGRHDRCMVPTPEQAGRFLD
ncbi:thiol-disulfide oxidoreductase DCC family protein [Spectribacter hydrogenoxidans]|uniref:Thiol-disulfide oxidoreductase DCC family protein n=1 Tax=Spectribacter hydrogenoxidans TaxID=3075608 RepID=A0ABU3BZ53_9GAMM|nr:thiol-disulfide oxidoreductase DCC family protein [Salinisphaera sp. W335]MDT0634584.1 thiol-disulfide oxidoreductase DCC family protein [Salinisphaera sp. W335]